MKKIILGSLFTIALLFSAQNIVAQNTLEINEEASKKTKELRKLIKFDSDKMDAVYRAYQDFGKAYKKISATPEQNQERIEKLNKELDKKLEDILSVLEYHNYLELVRGQ